MPINASCIPGLANGPSEPLCAPGTGDGADGDLWLPELGLVPSVDDVAHHGDLTQVHDCEGAFSDKWYCDMEDSGAMNGVHHLSLTPSSSDHTLTEAAVPGYKPRLAWAFSSIS